MSAQTLLFLLLVLACPLMMIFMMRGHGHGREGRAGCHGGRQGGSGEPAQRESLDDLRERRDELDVQIRALEEEERRDRVPASR